MSPEMKTVSNADGAVVGLRRRHPHGHTRRSALSVTMWVAGAGGARGGVQLYHKIYFARKVASEECETGITELGVQRAHESVCPDKSVTLTESDRSGHYSGIFLRPATSPAAKRV